MTPQEAADRCHRLIAANRLDEAMASIAPFSAQPDAGHPVLAAHGAALKALARLEDAIPLYERAVAAAPQSGVAEHNLAAAHGDLGGFKQAEAGVHRAFAKGLDAPETWIVLARALQGQNRLAEAESAYRETLRRRPNDADAHRGLAQLIWMRDADLAAATIAIDRAIMAYPTDPALPLVKSKAHEYAGDKVGAYLALIAGLERNPGDVALQVAAAHAASARGRPDVGADHAQKALAVAPTDFSAMMALGLMALAAGDAGPAVEIAEALRKAAPLDQMPIAMQATAWRLLGDPRAAELYDYDAFVKPYRIDTPPGWANLETYLRELADALQEMHQVRTHPFDQSLRHGSQVELRNVDIPAIAALPQALDGPIRAYLAALGQGDDPLRRRNTGGYRFRGIWSVRLQPEVGHHVGHVHPEGWISSACYIDLPESVADDTRKEGWIKFGEPGVPTKPELGPERFIKPEPGMLVLFPSYMWHGTTPFAQGQRRLTVAFDLLPA